MLPTRVMALTKYLRYDLWWYELWFHLTKNMVNKEWLLPIVSNKGLIIKGSWGKTHFDWSIHLHFWDFMAWKNTYPMKSSSFFFCMYTSFLSLHSCHSLSPWFCDCGSWVPCFAYIYNRKLFYPLSENCLWLILTERPSSFLSLQ